jgi:acetyl-CoA C-acetyltransferase
MIKEAYLTGGVRTPIGGFCGAFEGTPAPALGCAVVKAALARAQLQARDVDEVIFGNVVSAGLGQNVARQVSIGAGLGPEVGDRKSVV